MKLSPIVLFTYNRPEHTKKTIEALQKNTLANESDLVIFSDGYANDKHKDDVLNVRKYLNQITGFKTVKVYEREKNFGLAKSIISGVTQVVDQYGKLIVLEDDLVVSPNFLKYMNDALDLYEHKDEVISIHGYIYPVKDKLPETFFLKGADCYGWATWKRGWTLFEPSGQKLLNELKERKLMDEFDFSGSYPYTRMLENQIAGKNHSWAIRWYASAFLKNKLTLYPRESLVFNIGFDGSGTNCTNESDDNQIYQTRINDVNIEVKDIEVKEDKRAFVSISKYFKNQTSLHDRIMKFLKIRMNNFRKSIKI